jgi:hypothetical protein
LSFGRNGNPPQVLHDEHELKRIARARLEVEMLIEAFRIVILA